MIAQGQEVELTETDQSKFHRYQGVTYETPAFHLLFGCLLPKIRPLLEQLVAFRWKWSRPLQVKVLPKCVPLPPGLKWADYVTIGELILAIPVLMLLLAGYLFSFLSHELDGSGTIAAMAIMGSFITANKASSRCAATICAGISVLKPPPSTRSTANGAIVNPCDIQRSRMALKRAAASL